MGSVLEEGWFDRRGLPAQSDTLFYPIVEMIQDPTSELTIFFDTSLQCFALLLKVTTSFYTNLSGIPQLEFIFKISCISNNDTIKLPYYNTNIKKKKETFDSFLNEAIIQQENSLDSTRYGGNQIAPPVTSFAFFDETSSDDFLDILYNKDNSARNISDVVFYLKNAIKMGFKLGVIVMPKIGSITVSDYKKLYVKNDFDMLKDLYTRQIASVFQLVVFHKSFPFDLHNKNELIDPTTMKMTIIDYGKTVGLKPEDPNNENYLTDEEREEIYDKITNKNYPYGFEEEFTNLNGSGHLMTEFVEPGFYDKLTNYMATVLEYILETEIDGNIKRYGNDDSRMDFISKVTGLNKDSTKREIYFDAFILVRRSVAVKDESINQDRIQYLISSGRIIGFLERTPEDFFCDISMCRNDNGMCAIMGGTRKKTRRKQKHLKNKTKKRKVKKTKRKLKK